MNKYPCSNTRCENLVSNGWQPSINGLLRNAEDAEYDKRGAAVASLLRSARYLLDDEMTTKNQRHVLAYVLAAYPEAA